MAAGAGSSVYRDGATSNNNNADPPPPPPPPHATVWDECDEGDGVKRTGGVWTASAHIITAVIGSGVLSLPWSISRLGWICGPISLLAFAAVTFYTSVLLSDCYRSPDPVLGKRNHTYVDAIRSNLGGFYILQCAIAQYANLLGASIGYTITASISMVAIQRSNCFHQKGRLDPCHTSNNRYIMLFGAIQVFLSQIPDISKLWCLSIVAAIMSFSYSTTGLGLSIAKLVGDSRFYGSIEGTTAMSRTGHVWSIFQALGNIAFAYSFSMLLIEIQDTLRSPPPENKTMKRATLIGISTTTIFYMLCGCLGYAAFGNNAPGNLLTGFGFYNPYWLVDFANMCIVVHLIGAYQVYTQPLFAFVERWIASLNPKCEFIFRKELKFPIPFYGKHSLNLFRLVWRTAFVVVTTVISMLLPFFNDILGILGAVAFWPLTVYFPVEMHIAQNSIKRWSGKWNALQFLSLTCLLVSLAALLGSMEGLVHDLNTYSPFKSKY